jgi:citrate lyase subunit beta / citryl-CoA lyase
MSDQTPRKAFAGRAGPGVRSDCGVSFEPRRTGGIEIELKSKVESMYGRVTRELIGRVLDTLGVSHCRVAVDDQGALPFVIAARLECALLRSGYERSGAFLPETGPGFGARTEKFRMRRSRLYLPGNEPKFFMNAGLHGPDGVILDLEDSVALSEKDAARIVVRNALRVVDFGRAERMVRINQFPAGLDDLEWIIPHNVHVVLIPKCESAAQVTAIDERIVAIAKRENVEYPVYLMPIMESALGAIRAFEVASASPNVVSLAVGLEDYTADIGTQRTLEGRESFWARAQVVNAARAAGVQPIDTVFSDVADMEGLRASVVEAKELGFEGKGCIHPRQIAVVHEAFAPAGVEVEKAVRIVRAFDKAEAAGLGVVSLGTKMIDPPVVKRALRTVELAEKVGRLSAGWREEKE